MAGTVRDLGPRIVYTDKSLALQGTGRVIQDAPVMFDDFLGDTLDTNTTAVNKDAGATNFAINVQTGGAIRAACGTTDNDKAEIAGEIIWKPSKGLVFEARVNLSAITTVAAIVGLSDAKNEGAQLIAADYNGGTLTTTASDGVYWLFDTDQSTPKWNAVGVKGDTDATPVKSTVAPVAATFQRLRIEVDTSGNAAFMILDDSQPYSATPIYQTFVANACTAGTLLCPYMAVQARTTSSRNFDVDYWRVIQLSR